VRLQRSVTYGTGASASSSADYVVLCRFSLRGQQLQQSTPHKCDASCSMTRSSAEPQTATHNTQPVQQRHIHVTVRRSNKACPKEALCSWASRFQLPAVRPTHTFGWIDVIGQASRAFPTVTSLRVPFKNDVTTVRSLSTAWLGSIAETAVTWTSNGHSQTHHSEVVLVLGSLNYESSKLTSQLCDMRTARTARASRDC